MCTIDPSTSLRVCLLTGRLKTGSGIVELKIEYVFGAGLNFAFQA
jgi:hypothetical protein